MKRAFLIIACTLLLPTTVSAQTPSVPTSAPSTTISTVVEGAIPINTATSSVSATGTPSKSASLGFFARVKSFFSELWQRLFASRDKAVGSAEKIDQKLLAEFNAESSDGKFTWLDTIAEEKNPETAWAYLKAAYNTPAGVQGNAHLLAHRVGQLIYKAYGFQGLSVCDTTFAFGCYHGLMEVAFDKDHPEQYTTNILKAQEGCKVVGDVTSPSYWSCIHGMGHGVATYRDYDLGASLKDCDLLEQHVRTYCHDGVFMEFSISALPDYYKAGDPIYPCDTVGEDYRVACARSQAQVMRFRLKMSTGEIAKACRDTGDANITYHCVDSLGYFIGQTNEGDASRIVNGCADIKNTADAAQCTAAAAGELVFQNYAGWQNTTRTICGSLSGKYKDLCTTRVDQVTQSYGRK